MPAIEWKKEYSIQIQSIDEQHKVLIEIINTFEKAIEENKAKEIIGKTLNSLVDYTINHFKDEEAIMKEFSYPELEEHKKIHQKLVTEVGNCLVEFGQNEYYDTNELLLFLKMWLIEHILNEDKKIEKFITNSSYVVSS